LITVQDGWSQNKAIQIQSDTLLIDGVPKAKIMLKIVEGISLNFNVETYFFDPEFKNFFNTYRKSYEREVRNEMSRRISSRFYISNYRYADTTILRRSISSIEFSNFIQDSIRSKKKEPKTPGQHLARAGRSFNAALALGIGTGVLTSILAASLGTTGTLVLGGFGGVVILILYIDGNSSLIRAGEGLDRKVEKP
jgi:hypothetical protein